MGADYSACAMIGCSIPDDKVYRESVVPGGCSHKNEPGTKFCPECGRKAWIVDKVDLMEEGAVADTMYQLGLVAGRGTDNNGCVVGLNRYMTERMDLNYGNTIAGIPLTPDEFRTAFEETKEALTKVGLWDESTFGVWMVGHCSY